MRLHKTVCASFLFTAMIAPAMAETPVSSACETDYPPFCIVTSEGQAQGFSVELLRAALKAMGRDVTFRTGNWSEVKGWLENGEIQALPLVGRTPEREKHFYFTFPYMSLHGAIVVRKDSKNIGNLSDLRGLDVAVMAGDNAEEFLRREEREINIRATSTFDVALRELSKGYHDAVVIQRLVALRLIYENGIDNLRIVDKPLEGFRQDFCFAVKKGDSSTLATLNEGLALIIADGRYRHLHSKWFAAYELPINRRIVIGGDHNFPPFEYLDENGRPTGYNVEIIRAIADEMGLDIEIRLGPWARIREGLENGEIDAIQGMFYSPERDLKLDFTPPYMINNYIGVVRKGNGGPPATIEDLRGKRIIVQEGDMMHDFVLKNGLEEQTSTVDSQEDVLKELAQGKHDCALVSRLTALFLIDKHGWDNLDVGNIPILSLEYCCAVPGSHKALLTQLSEGLKAIEKNGEYRRIYNKWLGIYKEERIPLLKALRYSAMILLPLLLLLLLFLAWSWSLRRQVARRTEELRKSEEKYRSYIETTHNGVFISDDAGKYLEVNHGACLMTGYSEEEILKMRITDMIPEQEQDAAKRHFARLLETGVSSGAVLFRRKDGRLGWWFVDAVRLPDRRLLGIATDISVQKQVEEEQKRLQEQLLQSQKMESVGRLAGGVAHDFNNMLAVIIGYSQMLIRELEPGNSIRTRIIEIEKAAEHSADLTRQLLTFARRQTVSPKVLDLNNSIETMLKMLRRLIGEDIKLAWIPKTDLWSVKLDPVQINQILANLCVNARDAIAGVGEITIETDRIRFDTPSQAYHQELIPPGDYVLLSVSDNGSGMSKSDMEHIFEPFFTTKGVGAGTGLGLATVYGTVKQNSGFIDVSSELGKGSCFKIYFPRDHGKLTGTEEDYSLQIPAGQGETVLLVEDEPAILEMGKDMLEKLGYKYVMATTPAEAMRTVREKRDTINLVITDVIMPDMNGRDLASKLQSLSPGIKILYMSGYTDDVISEKGILDKNLVFIQKPFSMQELAVKIRAAIHGP